jgi:hypothetical protein
MKKVLAASVVLCSLAVFAGSESTAPTKQPDTQPTISGGSPSTCCSQCGGKWDAKRRECNTSTSGEEACFWSCLSG